MGSQCFRGSTSGAPCYVKDNKVLPLAVSEHALCLWRTLHVVLPPVVTLAVGLGVVVLNELPQLLHLGDQGLYGVPVIRTVTHIAPRSRGLLRNIAVDSLLRLAARADGSVTSAVLRSLTRLPRTGPGARCAPLLPREGETTML